MEIAILIKQREGGVVVGSASATGTTEDDGAHFAIAPGLLPGLAEALTLGDVELSLGVDTWNPSGGVVTFADDGATLVTATR